MSDAVRRILVVGATGSGKTTLARRLSTLTKIPHLELDLVRYERGWQETPLADFCGRVASIADGDSWIIDGNYAAVREPTWRRAQLVVWLDYPISIILVRLIWRTIRRI